MRPSGRLFHCLGRWGECASMESMPVGLPATLMTSRQSAEYDGLRATAAAARSHLAEVVGMEGVELLSASSPPDALATDLLPIFTAEDLRRDEKPLLLATRPPLRVATTVVVSGRLANARVRSMAASYSVRVGAGCCMVLMTVFSIRLCEQSRILHCSHAIMAQLHDEAPPTDCRPEKPG